MNSAELANRIMHKLWDHGLIKTDPKNPLQSPETKQRVFELVHDVIEGAGL